ncbi:DJ-1/PfpI family protein [Streptoalloteichus tenebrarius]|uniref:DJ-1/PfpI family protein n=1 Tax=Streptoalloteichus tenebrarius (strain ATCC 17920 / DSM 40477 / JCM 4838 / CBS 697.72 / NBRC 16177 / NCIMB 11028 / NRRL B-12390 / A12253. 1 / ISP 5477) TaxID=1933 RepID=A0ABT1HQ79_STRSD|nr:DJ-1/PfpI family protein [Streptoalloteichus tenebrarius]MCP2257615.1 DJ-1/PfpI family protein [Streptoalloteichus tenebrarius]BFE98572.1 DJ-1/PfpI family protein [Streptoalloteichus tenebrarius]
MLAQFVLFDGFDPLDVVAPYEVVAAAGVSVELVSAEGPREVPSGVGAFALRAAARLDPRRADLVVVPGASGSATGGVDSIPAVLGKALETGLPALLRQAYERPGVTVATVCGGSMLLAMAGLIAGRHATTHYLGMERLKEAGVHAVEARVVDDGDLVSGGGVTSGLDVALYLLERELGPRIAHAVERVLVHERRGTVWRACGPAPALAG